MKKIVRDNNWNTYDKLDGVALQGGETLRIEWPNGRITKETIEVHRGSQEVSDHGHSFTYDNWWSYVHKNFNGVKVRVPLAGLKAEKVQE